jgi:hypothetical protein
MKFPALGFSHSARERIAVPRANAPADSRPANQIFPLEKAWEEKTAQDWRFYASPIRTPAMSKQLTKEIVFMEYEAYSAQLLIARLVLANSRPSQDFSWPTRINLI